MVSDRNTWFAQRVSAACEVRLRYAKGYRGVATAKSFCDALTRQHVTMHASTHGVDIELIVTGMFGHKLCNK